LSPAYIEAPDRPDAQLGSQLVRQPQIFSQRISASDWPAALSLLNDVICMSLTEATVHPTGGIH
jgi:hypothetical protein